MGTRPGHVWLYFNKLARIGLATLDALFQFQIALFQRFQ